MSDGWRFAFTILGFGFVTGMGMTLGAMTICKVFRWNPVTVQVALREDRTDGDHRDMDKAR